MSDTRNEADALLTKDIPAIADASVEASGRVNDGAASLITKATEQVTAAVSEQKDGIADQIDDIADTVHRSGAQFEGKQDWIASAIDRGASELGALAKALRDDDLSSLLKQVQSLARQQPALFIGASLAAGFAVARLGKLVVADVSYDDLPKLSGGDHAPA